MPDRLASRLRSSDVVAGSLLVLTGALWAWWGWREGAYFGTVFYPGEIGLLVLLGLLLFAAPFRGRFGGAPRVALLCLVGLGAWTLFSIAWTSAPDAAVEDAQRAFLYAAAFGLGVWSCNLLGRRMLLSLAPVAVAGVLVGVATAVTLASGDDVKTYLHADATLRFPIGYRNANACFFLIAVWPLVTLASEGRFAWPLRALLSGGATLLLELAVLAQSRGSLPAAAVALLAFLALARGRLRAAGFLALAVLPMLPALPTLIDVFQYGKDDAGALPYLRDAARAIALTSGLSVAVAATYLRFVEPRLSLGPERVRVISRTLAVLAVAAVAVGGTVFVANRGGPVHFLDQRVAEFRQGGSPNFASQGTRYGANVGSNRSDFWRVALDQGAQSPVLGDGAGSFQFAYLEDRRSGETPNDPHSAEMLMFSELGLPGLLLFLGFVGAAGLAGIRSRAVGPVAAAAVAGSLAAGTQWFVQSSYDWFWHYPALTAPAIYMLGVAAAPCLLDLGEARLTRMRIAAIAVAAVTAVAAVPAFLAERYTDRAGDEWRGDAQVAFRDLDKAASLNPLDAQPLLVKGVIAGRVGDDSVAVSAFHDAVGREPDNYATHYFLAKAVRNRDSAEASVEIAEARRLNPDGLDVKRLQRAIATSAENARAGDGGE